MQSELRLLVLKSHVPALFSLHSLESRDSGIPPNLSRFLQFNTRSFLLQVEYAGHQRFRIRLF